MLERELGGDLPCVVCGYNLRGMSIRGVCPECGTAVRAAILAVVDPHAAAFTPIRHPRLVGYGLVLWCLGGVACASIAWLAAFGVIGSSWRLAAMVALVASALGAASLVRPHMGIRILTRAAAAAGVVLYLPLAWAVWALSPGPESPLAPLRANWSIDRRETLLRMAVAAMLGAILCCLRPHARLLVARSLVLRTGRVDRQTILAMAAAAATILIGEGLLLVSSDWRGWVGEAALSIGVLLRALGAGLFTLGLVGALVDSWRICRALVAPAPSLHQVVHGLGPRPPSVPTGSGS
jgi:hypothetical protein